MTSRTTFGRAGVTPGTAGRSLQEYLGKDLTDLASRPSAETLAARTVDRKNRTGTELPADTILHHLDVDRR